MQVGVDGSQDGVIKAVSMKTAGMCHQNDRPWPSAGRNEFFPRQHRHIAWLVGARLELRSQRNRVRSLLALTDASADKIAKYKAKPSNVLQYCSSHRSAFLKS